MYTDDEITWVPKEFMNGMVRNFFIKASHQSITFENSTDAAATTEMTHTGTTMDNDNMTEEHESQAHVHDTFAFQPVTCDEIDRVFA